MENNGLELTEVTIKFELNDSNIDLFKKLAAVIPFADGSLTQKQAFELVALDCFLYGLYAWRRDPRFKVERDSDYGP